MNPLSSMLTADEVQYAVTDTGARAVIASPGASQLLQGLKAGGARFELVVWDEAPVAGATRLREWLADASPEFDARPRLPSDLAAICRPSRLGDDRWGDVFLSGADDIAGQCPRDVGRGFSRRTRSRRRR